MPKKLINPNRQCSYCHNTYPLSNFPIKQHGKDGYAWICKDCKATNNKGNYKRRVSLPPPIFIDKSLLREGILLLDTLKKTEGYRNTKKNFNEVVVKLNECEKNNRITVCGCDTCPCKDECVAIFDSRFS